MYHTHRATLCQLVILKINEVNNMDKTIKVNKYVGGLVVTISSRTKPKQVREVLEPVMSFKEACALAISRA